MRTPRRLRTQHHHRQLCAFFLHKSASTKNFRVSKSIGIVQLFSTSIKYNPFHIISSGHLAQLWATLRERRGFVERTNERTNGRISELVERTNDGSATHTP